MTATKDNLIYHYCSTDSFFHIIREKELHLTNKNYVNDSSEADLVEFVLNKNFSFDACFNKDSEEASVWELYKTFKSDVFVSCFSRSNDSLGQWRGYADDGNGFAIGFDSEKLKIGEVPIREGIPNNPPLDADDSDSIGLIDINYKSEQELIDILMGLNLSCSGDLDTAERERVARNLLNITYSHKLECFKEENEWRIIYNPYLQGHSVIRGLLKQMRFKSDRNRLKPYFSMPLPEIKKIVLGPKNITNRDCLVNFLISSGFGNSIEITNSQIPYRD